MFYIIKKTDASCIKLQTYSEILKGSEKRIINITQCHENIYM